MNFNLSERARVIVSGLTAGAVTSLLMFTVVKSLSPQNLLRKDAAPVLAAVEPAWRIIHA